MESPPAVVLERLTVVQSFERRQLERSIQHADRRAAEQRFDLLHGGTIKETRDGRLQLGVWAKGGGFEFLRFRW